MKKILILIYTGCAVSSVYLFLSLITDWRNQENDALLFIFLLPLYLPLILTIGFSFINSGASIWKKITLVWVDTLVMLILLTLLSIFALPFLLLSDIGIFTFIWMSLNPMTYLAFFIVSLGVIPLVHMLQILGRKIMIQYHLASFRKNFFFFLKTTSVLTFLITSAIFVWQDFQWESFEDPSLAIEFIHPKETSLFSIGGEWNVQKGFEEDLKSVSVKDSTTGERVKIVIPMKPFRNGYLLQSFLSPLHWEETNLDKQAVSELSAAEVFSQYLSGNQLLQSENSTFWKGTTAKKYFYTKEPKLRNQGSQECTLVIMDTTPQTFIEGCWTAGDLNSKRRVQRIMYSVQVK